jgi:hypothetical protein
MREFDSSTLSMVKLNSSEPISWNISFCSQTPMPKKPSPGK